jgi:hypothetical protein
MLTELNSIKQELKELRYEVAKLDVSYSITPMSDLVDKADKLNALIATLLAREEEELTSIFEKVRQSGFEEGADSVEIPPPIDNEATEQELALIKQGLKNLYEFHKLDEPLN